MHQIKINSNRSVTGNSVRRTARIPRSVSEQDSILARRGTLLTNNPDQISSEMRDLMDLRARGIFDDRDVTDLLEAIKRTQKALESSSSKQLLRNPEPSPPIPKEQSRMIGGAVPILPSEREVSKVDSFSKNPEASEKPMEPKKTPSQKKLKISVVRTKSSHSTPKLVAIKSNPKAKSAIEPEKEAFKMAAAKSSPSVAGKSKTVTIKDPVQRSSSIRIKAALVSSIDEVKSIISEMTAENIPETQKRLQGSVNKALDSLTSGLSPFCRDSRQNLSSSFAHISAASSSLDPYNVDIMKDILSRHLDSAESIVLSKPRSRPRRRKTLAGKIVEYAAKNPIGSRQCVREGDKARAQEESLERLVKTNVVHFIDRAKRNVSVANAANLEIVKEGVRKLIDEATKAMQGLKDPSAESNGIAREILQDAKQMTLDWNVETLEARKNDIYQRLEQAVNALIPSSITTCKAPPQPDSVTKEKPIQLESRLVMAHTTTELDEAIKTVRGDSADSDFVLLISPLQDESKGESSNLQITGVNRKTAVINGQFLLSEDNYASLAKAGGFSKYLTVRISRDLRFFENRVDEILRCISEVPPVEKKQQQPQQTPPRKTQLNVLLKPLLTENSPALTSAAIRRSITINRPKELDDLDASATKKEPTLKELLHTLSTEFCTQDDLELFFNMVDKFQFLIFAHPDFRDDRCMYICELFTASSEYVGTTKIRGEDILLHLQKRPGVVKNFEVSVHVADLMLPDKLKQTLSSFFEKIGLLSVYDRVGMFMFNIYKKWGMTKAM